MSCTIPPSKSEVLSWEPQALAKYMKKHKLFGCDKIAIQQNITGERFLQMSECDLRVFPGHYFEKVKEFQKAISQIGPSLGVNNNHRQAAAAVVQQEEYYESYEPNESVYDNEAESLVTSLIKMKLKKIHNPFQDTATEPCSVKSKTKTRHTKTSKTFKSQLPEGSTHKDLGLYSSNTPSLNYSLVELKRQTRPLNAQSSEREEALDPGWYGGQMSRREAEAALTEVDKDGAFVVRDSSKGRAEHPYTLMVLKEAKIYNIKIRKQEDLFFLGTGLHNNKSFPGVREMITHHAHMPLLLIDAKDRSSETQRPLCCLLHPVGAQQ